MAELNAVVDLSYHNGLVTFAKAKKTGLLWAIHKATQGTQYSDPQYPVNRSRDGERSGPYPTAGSGCPNTDPPPSSRPIGRAGRSGNTPMAD